MDSYEALLRGRAIVDDPAEFTAEGTYKAHYWFTEAINLAPGLSEAYAELAYLEVRKVRNGWCSNRAASLQYAEDFARQALALHDDYHGHWSLAIVYWEQGKFDASFLEFGIARRLDPNNPDLDADEAEALMYGGEPDRAIAQINSAMSRKPNPPYWYWWNLGHAYYMKYQYREAISAINDIYDLPKQVLLVTAASKAQLGDVHGAEADMATFKCYNPGWSLAKSAADPYRYDRDRHHWVDGLRKAGLNSQGWP